jgi:hypothetical protein
VPAVQDQVQAPQGYANLFHFHAYFRIIISAAG